MKVLISDPDAKWTKKLETLFSKHSIVCAISLSGKECQLEVYRGGIDCLILDLDTTNYSGMMVLKYMRLNHPKVRLVLTIESKTRLESIGITQEDIKKLGVDNVLIKPYSDDVILKNIQGERYDSWKQIKVNDNPSSEDEKVLLAKDEEFTRVKIETCQGGNVTIFDHYIRLGKGRFVKVLKKGDSFDVARIQKFITDGKIEHLYFKTKDRTTYINFMNDLSKKMVDSKPQGATAIIADNLKSTTDMFIEEIYTIGIKPQLMEEGKKICLNMYQFVQKDRGMVKYLRELQAQDKNTSHLFMVSFFATIISKNLEWTSDRTAEAVAMGGLLHDIGKLKLPPHLRNLDEHEVPADQLALYRQHPLMGFEMLSKSELVSESVKQIVYQHHELVNGMGYPNLHTAAKIYPLAKIVSLADHFVTLITREGLTPIDGLRKFIPNKVETAKYDAVAIKSLVMGLIK